LTPKSNQARLDGKAAVVTGAGAGLGRAVALAFATAGAMVAAVSIDEVELAELSATASADRLPIVPMRADVSSQADVAAVAERVEQEIGRVDILVNNAAIIFIEPIGETTPEDWDRLIAINLRGPYLVSRQLLPSMMSSGGGTIINVSSLAGVRGRAGETAYTASKFGLEGFSRALAAELEPDNIRVMTIHPGILMETPMSMTTYSEDQRRRWQPPSLIAPAFVLLAAREDAADSGRRFNAWELVRQHESRPSYAYAESFPVGTQEV
jgi:NAD(P)-dependent dehydrogenase (short-subunit alcohol dehydrogenase family)